VEVTTDRAPAYLRVLDELLPAACHVMEQYANNPIESNHGRLKARLRPMRGLKRLRSARVIGPGTSSSEIFAAATTNSVLIPIQHVDSPRPSLNSLSLSDRSAHRG